MILVSGEEIKGANWKKRSTFEARSWTSRAQHQTQVMCIMYMPARRYISLYAVVHTKACPESIHIKEAEWLAAAQY